MSLVLPWLGKYNVQNRRPSVSASLVPIYLLYNSLVRDTFTLGVQEVAVWL